MWIEKLLLKKNWFGNLKVPKEKSTRPEGIIDKLCQTIIEQLTTIRLASCWQQNQAKTSQ